jgi:hypothetical protein
MMADLTDLNKELLKKVFYFYKLENSTLVEMNENCPIKTIKFIIATIDESNMRLRHSEEELGEVFKTLEF